MNNQALSNCIRTTLAISFSAAVVLSANAETVPLPTITKAFSVVEDYPDTVPVGTSVIFKKRDTILAKATLETGVQARVFSLGQNEDFPQPVTTVDECNFYVSIVIPLRVTSQTDVFFHTVDESWLNWSNSHKTVYPGRYLIVFEKSGLSSPHFHLKSSDARQYFQTGFPLSVSAKTPNINLVKAIDDRRERTTAQLRLESINPATRVPCYRYVRYVVDSEFRNEDNLTLAMCENPQNQF